MKSQVPLLSRPSTTFRSGLLLLGATAIAAAAGLGACGDGDSAGTGAGTTSSQSAGGSGHGGSGGQAPTAVTPPPFGEVWETLGEWNLFSDIPSGAPNERVVPYDLISPLFSDYALKRRYLFVPEGSTITYSDTDAWVFPVGTILVKTFAYPLDVQAPDGPIDLLETRILFNEPTGWTAHTYVYDATDAEADLAVAGPVIPVSAETPSGMPIVDYKVPNTNQCVECHATSEVPRHLGPSTRQLDRDLDFGSGPVNQLDHFQALGLFDKAPAPYAQRLRLVDPLDDANPDVTSRVRSYFDANCAHCHSAGGFATPPSGLDLTYAGTDPAAAPSNWGECVVPTSCSCCAGDTHDVVPGDPDASIMVCRLASSDPSEKMPAIGRIPHEEGVVLVRAWIEAMPATGCQ